MQSQYKRYKTFSFPVITICKKKALPMAGL